MIVVTGALGFIGSCMISYLQKYHPEAEIIAVDDFSKIEKAQNLLDKGPLTKIDRESFFQWFSQNGKQVKVVYHLGARTDTTLQCQSVFEILNISYSKKVWDLCVQFEIPLIYASSAATYGAEDRDFSDDHDRIHSLRPLNPYGWSKHHFDIWALEQEKSPPRWIGLKFFNVYGPNEYHKRRMASVIFHTFLKIKETGRMSLFRSHRPGIADGQQSRDFIFVKDVISVCHHFHVADQVSNGIYNLGTGQARSFFDLASFTFLAMGLEPQIDFIDTPVDIRDSYQYFTQADIRKLRSSGYTAEFTSLEAGIETYVTQYLINQNYY